MYGLFNLRKGVRSSILSHGKDLDIFLLRKKTVHHKGIYFYGYQDVFIPFSRTLRTSFKHHNHWQLLCKRRIICPAFKIVFKVYCPLFHCFPRASNVTNETGVLRWWRLKFLAEELGVSRIKSSDISKFIGTDWHFLSLSSRRHLSARTAWWGMAPWWLVGSRE